jgi:hypothetical protein
MWFLGLQSCNCNIFKVLLTFNCCNSLDLHIIYRVLLSSVAQLGLGVRMALLPCSSVWAFTIKQTPNCRCDRATSERADWPSSQEDAAERGNLYIFINERKCIILLSQGIDIQRNLTAMEPQYRVLSLDCKPSSNTGPRYSVITKEYHSVFPICSFPWGHLTWSEGSCISYQASLFPFLSAQIRHSVRRSHEIH